jgi:hypothetical protein
MPKIQMASSITDLELSIDQVGRVEKFKFYQNSVKSIPEKRACKNSIIQFQIIFNALQI